jgi:GTP-binding protein Era
LLRDAGTEARVELEARLGRAVHLDLRVVVEKDWQERPGIIERLGL